MLQNLYAGYAAASAYYAMLYVTQAFLEGEEPSFSKHSAVIAAFGQHFTKPGKVPAEFHRYLIEAKALRQAGDYGQRDAVSLAQAGEQIARAESFLRLAQELIGPIGSDSDRAEGA